MSHDDFETEPVRGLPRKLPEGERILWQGAPDWLALAAGALHGRTIALYFVAVAALGAVGSLLDGTGAPGVAAAIIWAFPGAVGALGVVGLLAWLSAKTTVYTITDRRVVIRHGVALTKAVSLPFSRIASASLKQNSDGGGDLALAVAAPDRVAYLQLWPHVRPWRHRSPEPTLRAIPDAGCAAQILALALAEASGRAALGASLVASPARKLAHEPAKEPALA